MTLIYARKWVKRAKGGTLERKTKVHRESIHRLTVQITASSSVMKDSVIEQ